MESYATDLLTALAVVMNGIPQGLLSLSLGFAAFPTAIAFLIGAAGSPSTPWLPYLSRPRLSPSPARWAARRARE